MKENICCVTYGELSFLVNNVISKLEDTCDFQIVEGLREETLEKIDKAILDGAEVIIAGGANAQVIRGYFNIPVLEYKVTPLDYITAIHKGFGLDCRVSLVHYKSPMNERMRECLRYMGMETEEIVYEDREDLEQKMSSSGCNVFVGYALAVDVARRMGKEGVLLYSGEDSILDTIEEARILIKELRKEKERNEFVRATMDYSPNGLMFLDTDKNIIDCNQSIFSLVENSGAVLRGRKLSEVLPQCMPIQQEEIESLVVDIHGQKLLERWVPICSGTENQTGYMIVLTPFSDYKKAELDYRKRKLEQRQACGFTAKHTFRDIIGSSYKMKACLDEAELFAQSSAAVLLSGETGVGKELFAQSIHNAGLRKDGPFVAVNCAALPANLLESELFGYDEGAFTGGRKGGKKGLFELADGGTLFLDEIGEILPELQARLLRAIQEKEIMHVGGGRVIPVDVRIITATNRNLEQMQNQEFRKDLYYRLSVLELQIPPLRDREDDVIELFQFYIKKNRGIDAYGFDLTEDIREILRRYSWRGNIRELQNVCERFCLYMERSVRFEPLYAKRCMIKSIGEERLIGDIMQPYNQDNRELAAGELKRLLSYNNEQIAKILGISRTTLWRMMGNSKK